LLAARALGEAAQFGEAPGFAGRSSESFSGGLAEGFAQGSAGGSAEGF